MTNSSATGAKLRVYFVAAQDPVDWEFDGRKGTTYRITVILAGTKKPADLKASAELFAAVAELGMMDAIELVFEPKVVLSVVNGRAVQELKFVPDTFEYVGGFADVAAD